MSNQQRSLRSEKAIEFECHHIQKAKHDLAEAIREGDGSGAPYNFKLRELEKSKQRLEAVKAKFTQEKKPQQAQAAVQ